jgi:D-amino-acid dehydrogenase
LQCVFPIQKPVMKKSDVIVVGAGVAGVLTAYHLAEKGRQVTVVDRLPGPAEDCSFANAGVVALGHAEAWGSPAAPLDLVRALLGMHPAVKVSKLFDPALWVWGIQFLRECTGGAYRRNSDRLLRTSRYSSEVLRQIAQSEGIDYHATDKGALYLYHNAREFERRRQTLEAGGEQSAMFEVLGRDQLLQRDPALAPVADTLAGGLLSRGDLSGDCRQFTAQLADKLQQSGRVTFHYGSEVTGVQIAGDRVVGLRTAGGDMPCDELAVAAGNYSPGMLKPLGVHPLIYPVKGYSATYPILDGDKVPEFPAIDETALVSYARYGSRLRMTAVAEFAGFNQELQPQRLQALDAYARRLCGDGIDVDRAEHWAGLRPSTPASTPYVGRVNKFQNLWINAGHGQLGWTMSAGCGGVLADLMTGKKPEIGDISTQANWMNPF